MCHSLSQSSVTVSACRRQVLGCSTCTDQWFAENNRCLHCRAENAQEKAIELNCLLNVLNLLRELFNRQFLKKTNKVSNNYHKKNYTSEK